MMNKLTFSIKISLLFTFMGLLFLLIFLWSFQSGSIQLDLFSIAKGLVTGDNPKVDIIKDLRMPRLLIAILVGINLPLATTLLQVVTKNTLADPGLLGISSGALLSYLLLITWVPTFLFAHSLFVCLGGFITCGLLLYIAKFQHFQPLQIVITGIALQATLGSLAQLLAARFATAVPFPSLGLKTWTDVRILFWGSLVFIVIALFSSKWCTLFQLDEITLTQLAVPLAKIRIFLIIVSVVLASLSVANVGVITFLGLLSVHIARLVVGQRYALVLPFSALVGASILLAADTIGRTWFLPVEVNGSEILAILGGPCLIILLLKGDKKWR